MHPIISTTAPAFDDAFTDRIEFLRAMIDALPIAVAVFDVSGVLVGTNAAAAERPELRALGTTVPLIELLDANLDPVKPEARPVAEIVRGGQRIGGRVVGIRDGAGLIQWMVIGATRLASRDERNPFYVMITAEDSSRESPTAARRFNKLVAERAREVDAASAEVARKVRVTDDFAASMSHELRTPLNAILGSTESLQEELFGPLSADQREALDDIYASGQHLLSLIDDILDLSRVSAGRLTPDIVDVEVIGTCEAALRMLQQDAVVKQIRIERDFGGAPATIATDGRWLRQILLNLLSNAVKFTASGGTVTLRVASSDDPDVIEFSVHDTGIGIAESDMQRIFLPFVQLDAGIDRQQGGTGLGLALVSRLSEFLGGGVHVSSTRHEGSTFTVRLPCSTSRVEPTSETLRVAPATPPTQSVRGPVLLADDNDSNSRMFTDYLQAKGFSVVRARDGLEALRLAGALGPCAILMDVQMPRMDGLAATRALREDARFATTPIIALTALAMPGDRERCEEAGVDEYFTKPVSLKLVYETLVRHIGASPTAPAPGRSA
jgi:signal transduction histidine kinase/CheY-like chemotaxis protein